MVFELKFDIFQPKIDFITNRAKSNTHTLVVHMAFVRI